jgi:hypothetical protein
VVATTLLVLVAATAVLLTLTLTIWTGDSDDGGGFWLGDATARCPWSDDSKVLGAGAQKYTYDVVFVLTNPSEEDLDEINAILMDVSDPDSDNYGLRDEAIDKAANVIGVSNESFQNLLKILADENDAFNLRPPPFQDSVVVALPDNSNPEGIAKKAGVPLTAVLAYPNLYGATSREAMSELTDLGTPVNRTLADSLRDFLLTTDEFLH